MLILLQNFQKKYHSPYCPYIIYIISAYYGDSIIFHSELKGRYGIDHTKVWPYKILNG